MRAEKLVTQMTLKEKIAQLGSISVWNLIEDGKFSIERARELLKNGIGQITRLAGWSRLNPERTVVVVGGRSGISFTDTCGEFRDRTELGLPGVQEELVREICQTGTPVVVVLVNGRP